MLEDTIRLRIPEQKMMKKKSAGRLENSSFNETGNSMEESDWDTW